MTSHQKRCCVQVLDLTNNRISSWDEVRFLSALPSLSTLNFSSNQLANLSAPLGAGECDAASCLVHMQTNGILLTVLMPASGACNSSIDRVHGAQDLRHCRRSCAPTTASAIGAPCSGLLSCLT